MAGKLTTGLHGRLALANTLLILLIIAAISAVQLFYFNQNSREVLEKSTADTAGSLLRQIEKRGVTLLDYLSESLANPVYQFDLEATYRLISPALENSEITSVAVFDAQGRVFHDGQKFSDSFGDLYANGDVLQSVLHDQTLYTAIDSEQLVLAKPVFIAEDEVLGGVAITLSLAEVLQDITHMQAGIVDTNADSRRLITLSIIASALVFSLLGVLISVLVSRSLMQPIGELVAQTKRIIQGEFVVNNQVKRQDEIGELARAFDEMVHSLKHRTDEISYLAYHDSLTSLPNRAMFISKINQLIASQALDPDARFAVMFLDLDEFKFVNDNYGHEAGDSLLIEIAQRITDNLRSGDFFLQGGEEEDPDEMVARIGGDEFLICLPHLNDEDGASRVATRLISAIRSPVSIAKDELVVAGSIGIALYPDDGASAQELIKNADIAMYQAKRSGKNTYANYSRHLNDKVKSRLELEQDLRRAVEDFSQFEIWYQPQFSIQHGSLLGAEALIRWRHPDKGLISPEQFIPVAEDSGLIVPLGEWIIDSVGQQITQWQPLLTEAFHVAVNLSAKQVYRTNAVHIFHQVLNKYQLSPKSLHVEVTESLLMKDEAAAELTLSLIRRLGIQVWLDDFGTGYSSLAYLKKFHVDGVKIDKSFVEDVNNDGYDRALASAIIDMAKSLDIGVVAEGVEDALQLSFLKSKACDIGQGYFYSRPLPALEFEAQFLNQELGAEELSAVSSG